MQLLEETEIRIEIADLAKRVSLVRPVSQPRSKGWHLSGVLKYCAVQAKIMKPGEPLEEELPLMMALGIAWEEFAASLYPDMIWQPGEECRDQVYGTPDGISVMESPPGFDDDWLRLEEFKFTRKKAKHGDDIFKDWMWMQQIRGYLGMSSIGLGDTHIARLHVCYLNGDYKPQEAKYIRYLLCFTQEEIEKTWVMINKNKFKSEKE